MDDDLPEIKVRRTRLRAKDIGLGVLAIYPLCLMANAMSLAGPRDPTTPPLLEVVAYAFLWGSMLYPVVYVVAIVMSRLLAARGRKSAAEYCENTILVYLLAVTVCFVLWVFLANIYGVS